MEEIRQAYEWLLKNKEEILAAVVSFWGILELIVRLTPTKTDDNALERLGKHVRRVLDFLRIPNFVKTPESGEVKNVAPKAEVKK